MVEVDFEGRKRFERHFLQPDAYEGKISSISDIHQVVGYEGKEVEKLVVSLEVKQKEETAEIPYFMTATIKHASKSNKNYSDSKLYTFLEKAELLESFKKMWETTKNLSHGEQNAQVVNFLRTNLTERQIRFTVKTVSPEEGEKYSVVGELIRFLDVPVREVVG